MNVRFLTVSTAKSYNYNIFFIVYPKKKNQVRYSVINELFIYIQNLINSI